MTDHMSSGHDHGRPDVSTQRSVLGVARAVLRNDPPAAVAAAESAPCSACLAIATVQFAVAVVAEMSGQPFVSRGSPLHRLLVKTIDSAEHELDAAPN